MSPPTACSPLHPDAGLRLAVAKMHAQRSGFRVESWFQTLQTVSGICISLPGSRKHAKAEVCTNALDLCVSQPEAAALGNQPVSREVTSSMDSRISALHPGFITPEADQVAVMEGLLPFHARGGRVGTPPNWPLAIFLKIEKTRDHFKMNLSLKGIFWY